MPAFCCETVWDDVCVDEVDSFGCGTCGAPAICGDGVCQPSEDCAFCATDCGPCGDCCFANTVPGCADATIEACVCAADSFCCDVVWDGICVEEVSSLGCGTCE